MRDKMLLILKEMQSMARQEDVKVIERYVNMWNPVRFVTQGEVETLVKELVAKHLEEQESSKREQPETDEEP